MKASFPDIILVPLESADDLIIATIESIQEIMQLLIKFYNLVNFIINAKTKTYMKYF
ncbi:hypothetical protein GCM10010937_08480 [Gluconobacter japonicus]|uniref:Uncharacterized protein n=1 Tax=Gluconobacter japonicus TaxID=376620 RepID=A0ABQ5WFV7_GLUJA|nr:hypothetical protein GCM10010937_08480 [Gluconobacter japonicus]